MKISNIKTSNKLVENTNIVGKASCVINDTVAVNNINIRKSSNTGELYIQMPQMKNAVTGNYQDIAFPITKDGRNMINNNIIEHFIKPEAPNVEQGSCNGNITFSMYNTNESPVVSRGSLSIDDEFVVKDIRIINSKNNNLFVALPSGYNKSTKQNYTLVSPANKEAYKHIVDKALKAHQQNLHQAQSFKFKEVTGDEINLISQNTSVKFDVLDMKNQPGSYIIRFNSADQSKINAVLQTAVQQTKR